MAVAERPHTTLGTELATFDLHRDELVNTAEGKYVLIKGDEVAGVFDSQMEAIQEGYRRFGNVPFLAKRIQSIDVPETFVSNLLAF